LSAGAVTVTADDANAGAVRVQGLWFRVQGKALKAALPQGFRVNP